MTADIDSLSLRLHNVETFAELREILVDHFTSLGITRMAYIHFPPPGAEDHNDAVTIASHGFPQTIVDLYISESLYLIDPVRRLTLSGTAPFWWSDAVEGANFTATEAEFLAVLQAMGLGDGLSIPVFGPFGRSGYVALGFGKGASKPDLTEINRVQLASQMGHQRYCELLRSQAPERIALSKREHEILEWVAKGKSNSVIADILGISTYTVDTYLRRIYLKLGVSDRVTAALRGLSIGMVA